MAKRFVKSKLYNTWNGKSATEKEAFQDSIIFVDDRKVIIEGNADGTGFTEFDGRSVVKGDGIVISELAKDGSTFLGQVEVAHADTSSQASISATAGKLISGVTLDGFGHVTGLTTADDKDTTYSFSSGTNKFTVTPLGGRTQTVNITPSLTVSADASDDDVVILEGTAGTNGVSYSASHAQKGPTSGYTSGNSTTSISGYGDSKTIKIPQITVDKYGHVTAAADESVTITMPGAQDLSGYKTVQTAVADPTAKGTATTFISSISQNANGVITATKATIDVSGKVDKVTGKGLSTNDYTTAEKNKLAGIASGAEVNVQSDWNVTDSSSDAFIKNKPTIGNGTLTVKVAGTSKGTFTANQTSNTSIDITAADLGLGSAMHFKGVFEAQPTAADYAEGDVIVIKENGKEYVLAIVDNAKTWVELGDEGSHALNSVTITGTGALSGGGSLQANRTITHNKVLGTAITTARGGVSGNTITVPTITADEYGHLKTVGTQSWTYTAPTIPTLKNVFGIVKVGSTSIEADSTRDTLELAAGTGITLTPDATNDKVTISAVNNGTVTSVGLSVPTGFKASGSPVTSSGTLALSFANGYSLPTTAKQGNWDTAYGWGNHASAGYVKSSGVTKVSTGAGLTGGDVTTTGTIKANLVSETKSTKAATASFNTASPYANAVSLDKNGKLMVDSSADWSWEVLS